MEKKNSRNKSPIKRMVRSLLMLGNHVVAACIVRIKRTGKSIGILVNSFYFNLKNPLAWQAVKWDKKRVLHFAIGLSCMISLGIILNANYSFPMFFLFVGLFIVILIVALMAEKRFANTLEEIRGLTRPHPEFDPANDLIVKVERSNLFIILPLLVVVVFGALGSLLFTALALSPTFIWVILFFSLVVYLSIVGYLQYIILFLYIMSVARDSRQYKNLIKASIHKVPAEVDWLQKMTQISHLYRTVFFSLGTLYIIAFAIFCFHPAFGVSSSHLFFYILWLIIFIAIVVVFPLVSCCEFYWIKRIVKKVKSSYIDDLVNERRIEISDSPEWFRSTTNMTDWIFAVAIQNTDDYPIPNRLSISYAFVLAVFNLAGSVYTLIELGQAVSAIT